MKPEEIHKIVQEHHVSVPAWILYTLVQYTEVSVKRGGISAGELSSVGAAYESGTGILTKLLKEHSLDSNEKKHQHHEPKLETIKEEPVVDKPKRKKKMGVKK